MCGCSGGISSRASGTSTSCSGRVGELQTIRNQLITLEKISEGVKLQEYKSVRSDIEELMKEASTTCPEASVVNGLKTYIANEYTSNNN